MCSFTKLPVLLCHPYSYNITEQTRVIKMKVAIFSESTQQCFFSENRGSNFNVVFMTSFYDKGDDRL